MCQSNWCIKPSITGTWGRHRMVIGIQITPTGSPGRTKVRPYLFYQNTVLDVSGRDNTQQMQGTKIIVCQFTYSSFSTTTIKSNTSFKGSVRQWQQKTAANRWRGGHRSLFKPNSSATAWPWIWAKAPSQGPRGMFRPSTAHKDLPSLCKRSHEWKWKAHMLGSIRGSIQN